MTSMLATTPLRRIAVIGVLSLLFTGGVVWLIQVGMAGFRSSGPGVGGTTPSASSTATTGIPPGTGGATARPGPPRPLLDVNVGGPLTGGTLDDSCVWFQNPYQVTITIEAVGLQPATGDLLLEHSHCADVARRQVGDQVDNLRPCLSHLDLAPGSGCYTGAQAAGDRQRPGGDGETYSARVVLTLRAVCTGANHAPCSGPEVAAYRPSPGDPIRIRWRDTCAPASSCQVTVTVPPDPDEPESDHPDTQDGPDNQDDQDGGDQSSGSPPASGEGSP